MHRNISRHIPFRISRTALRRSTLWKYVRGLDCTDPTGTSSCDLAFGLYCLTSLPSWHADSSARVLSRQLAGWRPGNRGYRSASIRCISLGGCGRLAALDRAASLAFNGRNFESPGNFDQAAHCNPSILSSRGRRRGLDPLAGDLEAENCLGRG